MTNRTLVLAFSLGLLLGLSPTQAQETSAWSGSYQSSALEVVLKSEGQAITGTVRVRGKAFALKGIVDEAGALSGTCKNESGSFPFTARLSQGKLSLTIFERTWVASRGGAAPKKPAGVPSSWGVYKHPLGWKLRYPAGWRVHETEQALFLTPSDLARDAQGQQAEVYAMNVVPAPGITKVDDARVVTYADRLVAQQLPNLVTRSTPPRTFKAGPRQAVELAYAGQLPNGQKLRAKLLAILMENQGVLLLAIWRGELKQLPARQDAIRKVMGSVGYKAPPRDQRMVGLWRRTSSRSSTPGAYGGDFSVVTDIYMLLRKDGIVFRGSRTIANLTTKNSSGDVTGGSSVDTGKKPYSDRGRWHSAGGRFYIQWDDGSTEYYGYCEVTTKYLLLKGEKKDKKAYFFERP